MMLCRKVVRGITLCCASLLLDVSANADSKKLTKEQEAELRKQVEEHIKPNYPCPPIGEMIAQAEQKDQRFNSPDDPEGSEHMRYEIKAAPGGVGVVLWAVGVVGRYEASALQREINAAKKYPGGLYEVWFHSPGGNADQGVEMGYVLRRNGVAVRLVRGSFCISACTVAFLGGAFRAIDDGGYYAVHMFSDQGFGRNDLFNTREKTKFEIQARERKDAQIAAKQYGYVMDMGVSRNVVDENFATWHITVSCPPHALLRQWNVTN